MQRHIGDVGVERLAHALSDQLDQRAEIELRGECLPDAVDGRELGHSLPGLVHEPSVVERYARLPASVVSRRWSASAKACVRSRVLQRDDAGRATADDERDEERRADRIAAQHVRVAVALGHLRRDLVDHQRLPRLHHVLAEADQRDRVLVQPLASLDHVGEGEQPARLVVDGDADDLRVEHLADPVADEVVDRLRVELPGDRGLDAVDQRQLGVPLPGLLDEARVLERGADTAGERDEQPLVGVAERVLAVDVLQRDDPGRTAAGHERHEERRLRRLAGDRRRVAVELGRRRHALVRPAAAHRSRARASGTRSAASVDSKRSPRSTRYGKPSSPVASS